MKASDTEALDMFQNLEGKQIWHISAPSTMSFSEIESLDVANALKGAEFWNHEGVAFEMSPTDAEGATLLLPKGKDGEYILAGTAITRAFRVQQSSNPKVSENTSESGINGASEIESTVNFFATQVGPTKPPRKQPENLRARYVPYGVPVERRSHGDVDSANVDGDLPMQDTSAKAASQRTPKSVKKTKSKKTSINDMDVDETPSKRKKES